MCITSSPRKLCIGKLKVLSRGIPTEVFMGKSRIGKLKALSCDPQKRGIQDADHSGLKPGGETAQKETLHREKEDASVRRGGRR